MADLFIADGVSVPEEAISLSFVRSSGPGGQNVNKVSSKVELRLDVSQIKGLTMGALSRLQAMAGRRWLEGGTLLITASETRNQLENRALAEEKLVDLIRRAIVIPKLRRETKPTYASKERRVQGKKERAKTKRNRGTYRGEE